MDFLGAGRVLHFKKPGDVKPHLWFVLTDPDPKDGRVVAVMVRTPNRFTDSTLILSPGEHPFLWKNRSCVDYSSASFLGDRDLTNLLKHGFFEFEEDMSDALLRKVRAGLLASPHTIHAIKDHCAERF